VREGAMEKNRDRAQRGSFKEKDEIMKRFKGYISWFPADVFDRAFAGEVR
jgi:hypothetical protein